MEKIIHRARFSNFPITGRSNFPIKISSKINHYPRVFGSGLSKKNTFEAVTRSKQLNRATEELGCEENQVLCPNLENVKVLLKQGVVLGALVCGVLIFGCKRVFAMHSVVNASYGVIGKSILMLKDPWPKLSPFLRLFKEQGLILAALLGLSAFFSMAETSITTLWPWKCVIRWLFCLRFVSWLKTSLKMVSLSDVTRFLTTILIGTTVVNIGATALVTEAATTIFDEAGVSAATGLMTVAILLLTEITPKSIAVHNATEVARFVVRPVAWLSLVLYTVGRVVTYLSMGMLKALGLKGRKCT